MLLFAVFVRFLSQNSLGREVVFFSFVSVIRIVPAQAMRTDINLDVFVRFLNLSRVKQAKSHDLHIRFVCVKLIFLRMDASTLKRKLFATTLKLSALYQSDVLQQLVAMAMIWGPDSNNDEMEMQTC